VISSVLHCKEYDGTTGAPVYSGLPTSAYGVHEVGFFGSLLDPDTPLYRGKKKECTHAHERRLMKARFIQIYQVFENKIRSDTFLTDLV
jgi:hypothetical protein